MLDTMNAVYFLTHHSVLLLFWVINYNNSGLLWQKMLYVNWSQH